MTEKDITTLPNPPHQNNSNKEEPIPRFSIPQGWSFCTTTTKRFLGRLRTTPASNQPILPLLRGVAHHYKIEAVPSQPNLPQKRKGWQRPGPGPRRGLKRVPCLEDMYMPLLIAVIHLTKEAIHFQQIYSFESLSQEGHKLDLSSAMNALNIMEDELPISRAMRKCIWPLTHQLGVPAFLVKLRSPFHAIALHRIPQTHNHHWSCSQCQTTELSFTVCCIHSNTIIQCMERIAETLGCTLEYLICSMNESSAFHHIPELSPLAFYGFKSKPEFAIIRTGNNEDDEGRTPITSTNPIYIAKHMSNKQGWKCLYSICTGNSKNCAHFKAVDKQIQKGLSHCFSSVHELVSADEPSLDTADGDPDTEREDIRKPRYSRPMIPSELAFQVDFRVNRDARTDCTQVLQASENCFCGKTVYDMESSDISRAELRVESLRCFVTYGQEIWYCSEGHCVTPEDDSNTREGLLWISKDTAFTEVFLFEILLHTTIAGTTISSQADLRSQILSLQTNYLNTDNHPRSTHTLRKALIAYAMSVVQSIPSWVFRCSKFAISLNGNIYYDKLSFDGQQLGFNIRKDVRYEFYGKPSNPWRRPVAKCSGAYSYTMIIESGHLRSIVVEALRVRNVPPGCNAVEALCRVMMKISLRTKDTIRAAIAALKLFDTNWRLHVPNGVETPDETTFSAFSSTFNPELCVHPIQFIASINNEKEMRPEHYEHGMKVMRIFEDVLDCTAAAAVLSVLINDLKADLKTHIPLYDIAFLDHFASSSRQRLHEWISHLSSLESAVLPVANRRENQENTRPGIAEYAESLQHPFRMPFTWKRIQADNQISVWKGRRLARVKRIGVWTAPDDAQIPVLLLFMAMLTESVLVWIRDGELNSIRAGMEMFRIAEMYCGRGDAKYHYCGPLKEIHNISLLYEGTMGLIGANTIYAKRMFLSCQVFFQLIYQRFNDNSVVMEQSTTQKQFMCTTKEFDDMPLWTDTFRRDPITSADIEPHHVREMRNLYEKMAKSKSNDFLESGVWAPDFPVRRPSSSSSMWASETSNTDTSCSNDYSVHNAFSPGTFGGYCLCRHAKTVMISFLKRPEGCLMPINFLIERCATLPRYVVYDFACGSQKSATNLSLQLSKNVRFVIDPFHFPGHKTCSLAMHQFNFNDLKGSNSVSQEQRNGRIKVMERTLRASRDVHFIHLVILAHAYLNLKAIFRYHCDSSNTPRQSSQYTNSNAWIKWVRDNLFN